jgi:hypothetical protein
LFHSIQKPWFRRKIVTDVPSVLQKVIPIQHILQAFNSNPNCTKPRTLAWSTCLSMRHNTSQLSALTTDDHEQSEPEAIAIRKCARSVKRCISAAQMERLLQYLLPPLPTAYGACCIVRYQTLCVISRTYCEAVHPELIELFTKLV